MVLLFLDCDSAIDFLRRYPNINEAYSYYYSRYFPDQRAVFSKDENKLTKLEKKYKKVMVNALDKSGYFNMIKYLEYIQLLFEDYGIYKMYIVFFIDKGYLIGSCIFCIASNKMDSTLTDLFISEPFRKLGYSKILTNFVIKKAKQLALPSMMNKIILDVDIDNAPAIRAYKACGFKPLISFDAKKMKLEYVLK